MKAEELMIGDWICTEHDSTPRQIDWIRTGEVGLLWNKVVTPPYLVPIQLTAEILEKNGFKNISVVTIGAPKMRWVSDDTRTEITIWMDDTLPMEIVKNVYYEDEVAYTLPFPCTVSQLQHALRLCGIEKEIMV